MRTGQGSPSEFEIYAGETDLEFVSSVSFNKGKFSGIKKSKKSKKIKIKN
jgi:hypothetical protein